MFMNPVLDPVVDNSVLGLPIEEVPYKDPIPVEESASTPVPSSCDPVNVDNAAWNTSSTDIGVYVNITCDTGFKLSHNNEPSEVLHCQSNGIWSSTPNIWCLSKS